MEKIKKKKLVYLTYQGSEILKDIKELKEFIENKRIKLSDQDTKKID